MNSHVLTLFSIVKRVLESGSNETQCKLFRRVLKGFHSEAKNEIEKNKKKIVFAQ